MPRKPANDPFTNTTPEEGKKRQRAPMDRFRAARLCDIILSQLPDTDRVLVVEFIRTPRQTRIPGTEGNA